MRLLKDLLIVGILFLTVASQTQADTIYRRHSLGDDNERSAPRLGCSAYLASSRAKISFLNVKISNEFYEAIQGTNLERFLSRLKTTPIEAMNLYPSSSDPKKVSLHFIDLVPNGQMSIQRIDYGSPIPVASLKLRVNDFELQFDDLSVGSLGEDFGFSDLILSLIEQHDFISYLASEPMSLGAVTVEAEKYVISQALSENDRVKIAELYEEVLLKFAKYMDHNTPSSRGELVLSYLALKRQIQSPNVP